MIAIAETQKKLETIEAKPKLTFAQFLELCPTDGRYEFVDGQIVDTSGNFFVQSTMMLWSLFLSFFQTELI